MKKPGFSRHIPDPEPPKPQSIPSSGFRESAHASHSAPEPLAAVPSPWPDGPGEWRAELDAEIRRLEAEGEEFFLLGRLKRLARLLAKEIEVLAILVDLEDELEALWVKLRSAPWDQQAPIRAGIATVEGLRDRCKTYLNALPSS